jgi:aryl-alcohol dehydrogenase-like predicted oxidoreductase
VTSALVGASSAKQIEENVGVIEKLELGNEELQRIESILAN